MGTISDTIIDTISDIISDTISCGQSETQRGPLRISWALHLDTARVFLQPFRGSDRVL